MGFLSFEFFTPTPPFLDPLAPLPSLDSSNSWPPLGVEPVSSLDLKQFLHCSDRETS